MKVYLLALTLGKQIRNCNYFCPLSSLTELLSCRFCPCGQLCCHWLAIYLNLLDLGPLAAIQNLAELHVAIFRNSL